jgi:hypothetical protein
MIRERDKNRSVKTQTIIIKNVLRGAGQPKKTFIRTGQISDQLPAGSR